MADRPLTEAELAAILNLITTVQGEAMLGRLDARTVERLAKAFTDFAEIAQLDSRQGQLVQGLERLTPRIRHALGEIVAEEDARPLR